MGSCSFIHVEDGINVGAAFSSAVADAICEYGKDPYNGTISTCNLGYCKKIADKYSKTVEKEAYKFVTDNDYGDGKRVAYALDMGVSEYLVRTVKKVTKPSCVKYKVLDEFYHSVISSFKTKQEAEQAAEKYAIKKGDPVFVMKEEGSSSHYYIEEKTYKTKPNLKPMKNREVLEIHKYMFYGWAAC